MFRSKTKDWGRIRSPGYIDLPARHRRSPLMTREEIAKRLGLSERDVRGARLRATDERPAPAFVMTRNDGKRLYRLTEYVDFLRQVGLLPTNHNQKETQDVQVADTTHH